LAARKQFCVVQQLQFGRQRSHVDVDAQDSRALQNSASVSEAPSSPAWRKQVQQGMDDNFGDEVEGGSDRAAQTMFEMSVADGMQWNKGESEEMRSLKDEARCSGIHMHTYRLSHNLLLDLDLCQQRGVSPGPSSAVGLADADAAMQMSSILSLVNDRLSSLEDTVERQNDIIMHLEYKLDTVQGKAAKMPYLSGRFGYGLGRPAVKREVLLFAKKAQTGRVRDDWPTVFIGKHRTDLAGARFRCTSVPHAHHVWLHACLSESTQGCASTEAHQSKRSLRCPHRRRQARADRGAGGDGGRAWPLRHCRTAAGGQHVRARQPLHPAAGHEARPL
jgi:hypothetical protein